MQELKESVQKMTTESQDLGSSVRELKELLSQFRDKSASHSSSKPEEPESSTHNRERLSQTSGGVSYVIKSSSVNPIQEVAMQRLERDVQGGGELFAIMQKGEDNVGGFQGGLDSGSSSPCRGQGSWSRAISFKDKLVGEIPGAFTQAFNFGDCMEDDEESDKEVEVLYEGLAAVKFSKEFKQHIRTPWSKAIIVKVFGRTVGFSFLHSRLLSMWKPTGRLDCVGLGLGFFLVRLSLKEDYENILRKGPWFIGEHFLSIRPWEANFRPASASVSSIAVWIRLNELPIEYYNVEALLQIGKSVGNVLRIDTHTAFEAKGRFARLCVHIDIDKPLITTILIGKFEQPVCYEGVQKLCFSCGRMGHRRENCLYTIRQCSQVHEVETVAVEDKGEQSRKEYGLDNAKTVRGPPRACKRMCKRRKNGTKTQRSGRTPSGSANGHLGQMQEICGNGVSANMGLCKVEPNNGPSREAKRKLSSLKVINKAQLVSSLQTIRTDQTPTDVSLKTLDVANMDVRAGNEAVQVKPNHRALVKAKKVLARAKASQVSAIGAAEREQSSSSIVHAQKEKLNPISSGDQVTCDGGGKPRSSRESKSRSTSQLQLSSMPWPEVGYKFGEGSSGKSKGGDSKNLCKFGASHGVVQQQFTKGMEVDIPFDSREGKEWSYDSDRSDVGKGGEVMVATRGGCAVDGGGTANDLGSTATDINSACDAQKYHGANSSLSAKCDVQFACNVSGDGEGRDLAQFNADPKGRTVSGYAEWWRWRSGLRQCLLAGGRGEDDELVW
nr:uncharacterized protein CFP56_35727 [Quercus suber]